MTPLTLTVTPSAAADAYRAADGSTGVATGTEAGSFGGALRRAVEGAVQSGEAADAQSMQAIAGGGNITEVVTAVSKAELALKSTVVIRDRVVQAYQDIMRMPI